LHTNHLFRLSRLCPTLPRRINGIQKFPIVRRLFFEPNTVGGDDFVHLYCDKHALDIRKNGKSHDIENYDWLRYPENGGTISSRITLMNKPVVDNEDNDIIESGDEGGDSTDVEIGEGSETDDDLDVEMEEVEDIENDEGELTAKLGKNDGGGKSKGARTKEMTKIPRDSSKRKRKHNLQVETAKDRLLKKMANQQNQAVIAGTLTSHITASGNQSTVAKAVTADIPLVGGRIPLKSAKAGVPAVEFTNEESSPKIKKKKKPAAINLAALVREGKTNWNPIQESPDKKAAKNELAQKGAPTVRNASSSCSILKERSTFSTEIPDPVFVGEST